MRERGRILAAVTLGLTFLVALMGSGMVGVEERPAVWLGALAAGGLQAALFAVLPLWLGSSHRFLMYGLGMLARFGMFAFVALLALPLLEMPAAPVLFSFVVVFFATTLLEPFFLQTRDTTVR